MKEDCSKLSDTKGNSNGYSTAPCNYRHSFIPCLQHDFKSYAGISFSIPWWKNTGVLQVYWKCTFNSTVEPWMLLNNGRKEWRNYMNVLQVKSVIWELTQKLHFLIPCSLSSLFDHRGKSMLLHMSVCLQKLFQCCLSFSCLLLYEMCNIHIPLKYDFVLI